MEISELYAKLALGLVVLALVAPPRVGTGGVTVALPPGWHSVKPAQGGVIQPRARLAVASGPIAWDLTSACQTQIVAYRFPSTAVAIVVVEWTKALGGPLGRQRPRPRHFTAANLPIRRPPAIECFPGPGGSLQWSERGHDFGAYVLIGREAPRSLAARARAVLDTLRVSAR